MPQLGVVRPLTDAATLAKMGFDGLTASTQELLSPLKVTDDEFSNLLAEIRALPLPLYACNLFIPRELKVVGTRVDEAAILNYVEVVFQRAAMAGVKVITWGSGGSRQVPDGFSRVTATAQFIYMAGRVADVARRYDVLIALENLNTGECNFITSLPEALSVVRAVDHPNLRLCVDIYHMLREREPAENIAGVGRYAVYCEVAEREGRTPPGEHGDDLTPYFAALYQEGYTGMIMIEASWDDLSRQAPVALQTVTRQLREAYGQE